jgi:serine/threonine protein kinase
MSTSQWKIIREIGEGASSKVFLAENLITSEKYALKLFSKVSRQNTEETTILTELKHQSIIELKELVSTDEFSFENFQDEEEFKTFTYTGGYAMKYAAHGDLLTLMMKFGTLPELLVRSYANQLVDALEYLHNQRIAHRDLKLENLLLDERFCLKLADFGASKVLSDGNLVTGEVGTERYYAPEITAEGEYDAFSADVFALGVTIFELFCGHSPFQSASAEDETYSLIIENKWEEFWALHEEICSYRVVLDSHIKELLQSLICADAQARPKIHEIKNSAWMKKISLDRFKIESWIIEIAKKKKISELLSAVSST